MLSIERVNKNADARTPKGIYGPLSGGHSMKPRAPVAAVSGRTMALAKFIGAYMLVRRFGAWLFVLGIS